MAQSTFGSERLRDGRMLIFTDCIRFKSIFCNSNHCESVVDYEYLVELSFPRVQYPVDISTTVDGSKPILGDGSAHVVYSVHTIWVVILQIDWVKTYYYSIKTLKSK